MKAQSRCDTAFRGILVCNIFFLVTDITVLSDLIFWLNKLGVNVGIIPI